VVIGTSAVVVLLALALHFAYGVGSFHGPV
jgi:hypothetical protein